ncbi:MAG: hypothetical protein WC068_00455 [Caulobacter sp.]
MTGAFSIWHWLIVFIWVIVPMFPISTILKKAGRGPWWALLYVVPLVNLIALFVFAYSRWPRADNSN